MQNYAQTLATTAKQASALTASYNSAQKNAALKNLARLIQNNIDLLIAANLKDVNAAQERHLDAAFIDRLTLTHKSIEQMVTGLNQIIDLPDPIGEILNLKTMPSGINVGQMRVPLGVIAIIYEARPNVTIDAAALCLKSGNACILRGGSEALHSNQALANLIKQALIQANLSEHAVRIVQYADREILTHLVTLKNEIDIVVPRGGKSLIEFLIQHSKIPMIKHLDGICHSFVDEFANIEQALIVCDNAKTQRYAPCNTMETLLIHQNIASVFLPKIAGIYHAKGVELRGCANTLAILQDINFPATLATEQDWYTEYLAPIISIKIVENLEAAITHINQYGSHHTDAILTEHHSNAMKFLRAVDSASVMINASTRFADGFEYGLGAEIGISTDKLHARGPVGLNGLTSLKYKVGIIYPNILIKLEN